MVQNPAILADKAELNARERTSNENNAIFAVRAVTVTHTLNAKYLTNIADLLFVI